MSLNARDLWFNHGFKAEEEKKLDEQHKEEEIRKLR